MNPLKALGWNEFFEDEWQGAAVEFCVPGRVVADYGSGYKVALPEEITAEVSGKLQYMLEAPELPKIGDWVAVQKLDKRHSTIHEVLPRRTEITRKQPGVKVGRQVLAANVDVAFLIQALDNDFSPERLQRYLFQLGRDGIRTVIVLNKSDIAQDIDEKMKKLESFDADVIVTSAKEHAGLAKIPGSIESGNTAVLLGSSGVGKSTIINALLGDARQATQDIRKADSKGRHTTTHRELFVLPGGGLLIDTPGLRELQLWGTEEDLEKAFPDVEELVAKCRFANCLHTSEPGCAVLDATLNGQLDAKRFDEFVKYQKELRYLKTQVDEAAALAEKLNRKKLQRHINQVTSFDKRRSR